MHLLPPLRSTTARLTFPTPRQPSAGIGKDGLGGLDGGIGGFDSLGKGGLGGYDSLGKGGLGGFGDGIAH